jgi:hypothetical protein
VLEIKEEREDFERRGILQKKILSMGNIGEEEECKEIQKIN